MQTNIIAFGIAKDIIGDQQLRFDIQDQPTVGNLKSQLCQKFPAFEQLRSLAIAVNEEYQGDEFLIKEGDEVVIIPPVSGG